MPDVRAGARLMPSDPTDPKVLKYVRTLAQWPHVINPRRAVAFDGRGRPKNNVSGNPFQRLDMPW